MVRHRQTATFASPADRTYDDEVTVPSRCSKEAEIVFTVQLIARGRAWSYGLCRSTTACHNDLLCGHRFEQRHPLLLPRAPRRTRPATPRSRTAPTPFRAPCRQRRVRRRRRRPTCLVRSVSPGQHRCRTAVRRSPTTRSNARRTAHHGTINDSVRTTTSYAVTGLRNGTCYYFRALAKNAAGTRRGRTRPTPSRAPSPSPPRTLSAAPTNVSGQVTLFAVAPRVQWRLGDHRLHHPTLTEWDD